MSTPILRPIKYLVIHCSDSPDDMDIGVKEITAWHVEKGFRTIGYHAVVRRNGAIEYGRYEHEIGAHVKGHNQNSLGICWVGREHPAAVQMATLKLLVRTWRRKYNLPIDAVVGHRELAPLSGKTCPNLDMVAFRDWIAKEDKIQ